ncbi:hypothetical protein [Demequina mangrovi]|uniref:Uncharacterized protein n=1 Tax=Demequina mangrovi TaxID=1043493 RepID=A0A1H6TYS9_9MICO|nr:hypothetical protein [Demequina mangrovi]SEI84346.1 hypothetical protein SAMN05421637_0163 [Demequina mangrovi]
MLTDTDPAVLARINMHAVLGALVVLAERAPEAPPLLAAVDRPMLVRLRVPGLPPRELRFASDGVSASAQGDESLVTLAFTSPAHLNAMVDGHRQPIPIAGPAGLAFLTKVFAPLADLLGRYLKPSEEGLADPAFRATSALLTLHVAIAAVAQVANADRSGRFSAALIPDGEIGVEVGDGHELRLVALDHALTFEPAPASSPARAVLAFRDLDVAGDVLAGRASALACIGDGSMSMRGFIPMIDNVSRILDRVGHYLGD